MHPLTMAAHKIRFAAFTSTLLIPMTLDAFSELFFFLVVLKLLFWENQLTWFYEKCIDAFATQKYRWANYRCFQNIYSKWNFKGDHALVSFRRISNGSHRSSSEFLQFIAKFELFLAHFFDSLASAWRTERKRIEGANGIQKQKSPL